MNFANSLFERKSIGKYDRPRWTNYFSRHPKRNEVYDDAVSLNKELLNIRDYENSYRENCIIAIEDLSCIFTLDLHGFGRSSAIRACDKFISFALLSKIPRIRIIYGRGKVLSESIPDLINSKGLSWEGGGAPEYDWTLENSYGYADITITDGNRDLWPNPGYILHTRRWSRICVGDDCEGWIVSGPDMQPEYCGRCGIKVYTRVWHDKISKRECPKCNTNIFFVRSHDKWSGSPIRQRCFSCKQAWQISDKNIEAVNMLDGYEEMIYKKKISAEKKILLAEQSRSRIEQEREQRECQQELKDLRAAKLTRRRTHVLAGISFGTVVALAMVMLVPTTKSLAYFLLTWFSSSVIGTLGMRVVSAVVDGD